MLSVVFRGIKLVSMQFVQWPMVQVESVQVESVQVMGELFLGVTSSYTCAYSVF